MHPLLLTTEGGVQDISNGSVDLEHFLTEHHKKKKFREEYMELLRQFEIDFDKKYLFEFLD